MIHQELPVQAIKDRFAFIGYTTNRQIATAVGCSAGSVSLAFNNKSDSTLARMTAFLDAATPDTEAVEVIEVVEAVENVEIIETVEAAEIIYNETKAFRAPTKLTQVQRKEFSNSAISVEYQNVNFRNVSKAEAKTHLIERYNRYTGGDASGWSDTDVTFIKPKNPRTVDGKVVKYENVSGAAELVPVTHPAGIEVSGAPAFVEGWKKAVSFAEETARPVYSFAGLAAGIHLADKMQEIALQYTGQATIVLDNDTSLNAQALAQSLLRKVPNFNIPQFNLFKGIDDVLVNSSVFELVSTKDWVNGFVGYGGNVISLDSRYLPASLKVKPSTQILALISGKGTGKTTLMSGLSKSRLASGGNVFYMCHRIALATDAAIRLSLPFIDADADEQDYSSGALCVDSILNIKLDKTLHNCEFFIDEVTQVWEHLHTSDTLKGKRSQVQKHLYDVMKYVTANGGRVVLADADLNEWYINHIAVLANADHIEVAYNTCIPVKGIAQFFVGHKYGTSELASDWVAKMVELIRLGKKIFISTTSVSAESKFGTKVLAQYLSQYTDSIVEINAETTSDSSNSAYKAITNINSIVDRYQVIIASPTLATGVDITAHVDAVFVRSSGLLTGNSTRQASARVRDFTVPRYIYVPFSHQMHRDFVSKFTSVGSINDYVGKAMSLAVANATSNASVVTAVANIDAKYSEVTKASSEYLAAMNAGRQKEATQYREIIMKQFAAEGYAVSIADANDDTALLDSISEQLTLISTEHVLVADALLIAAPLLTKDEFVELLTTRTLTPAQKAEFQKYKCFSTFGVELTTQELVNDYKAGKFGGILDRYNVENIEEIETIVSHRMMNLAKQDLVSIEVIQTTQRLDKVRAVAKTGVAKVGILSASDLELGQKIAVENSKQFVGSDTNQLKAELRRLGYNVFQKKIQYKGSRCPFTIVELETTDTDRIIYEHAKSQNAPKLLKIAEMRSEATAIELAALQDANVKYGDVVCMKYTNLATRSKASVQVPKPLIKIADKVSVLEVKQWLQDILASTGKTIAIDCETMTTDGDKQGAFNYQTGAIRLLQICDGVSTWVIDYLDFDAIAGEVKAVMESQAIHKVGHNFQFDIRFLRKRFDIGANDLRNCGDTLTAVSCLLGDYGAAKVIGKSLKVACYDFLGIEMDKTEQKSNWSGELTTAQITYAAVDAHNTWYLNQRLQTLLDNPSLIGLNTQHVTRPMYELECEFLEVVNHIELTGYDIDVEQTKKCFDERNERMQLLVPQWRELVGDLTPNQTARILLHINAKYKLIEPMTSLAKEVQSDLAEVVLLRQMKAVERDLSLLRNIAEQGHVYPVVRSLSGTGRCSVGNSKVSKNFLPLHGISARTNVAIPKDWGFTQIRSCFLVEQTVDLCASHGHISANLSGDTAALAAYMDESIDNHCVVAASVALAAGYDPLVYTPDYIKANKKSGVCKQLRDAAKNTYYGWLNGAGVSTVKKQIQANLGISVDSTAAKVALDGLANLFVETTEFIKGCIETLNTNYSVINGEMVGHLIVRGELISWGLGKVGSVPSVSPTKATGSIWSRLEASLMKKAGIAILDGIRSGMDGKILAFNHDDYNLAGSVEFKEFAHSHIKASFKAVCPATCDANFSSFESTVLLADGVTPVSKWSDK
ncbi:MAG: plasmid replication protein, CyRepA1 family [Fusobacteriaceae bacterium]